MASAASTTAAVQDPLVILYFLAARLCLHLRHASRERQAGCTDRPQPSLRHRHQLQHVPVGILEIDAGAAAPIVELAVVKAPRRAAVGDLGFLDAPENGVEVA